jgi:fructose-1,6-bisphosphatase/inositol monophosphatase family enzyme
MNDDAALLMQAAGELARHAGGIALRYFRPGIVAETKGDGSPVTEADRAAEQSAREWLASRFPHDGILVVDLVV